MENGDYKDVIHAGCVANSSCIGYPNSLRISEVKIMHGSNKKCISGNIFSISILLVLSCLYLIILLVVLTSNSN